MPLGKRQRETPREKEEESEVLGQACISGKTYTVFLRTRKRKDNTLGKIFYERKEIVIYEAAIKDEETFLTTLIHEFIHAILDGRFDADSEEKIASLLDAPLSHALITFFPGVSFYKIQAKRHK